MSNNTWGTGVQDLNQLAPVLRQDESIGRDRLLPTWALFIRSNKPFMPPRGLKPPVKDVKYISEKVDKGGMTSDSGTNNDSRLPM